MSSIRIVATLVLVGALGCSDGLTLGTEDAGNPGGDAGTTTGPGPDGGTANTDGSSTSADSGVAPTLGATACSKAISVSFSGTSPEGYPRGTIVQDLASLSDVVPRLPCASSNSSSQGTGKEVVFRVELTQAAGLQVNGASNSHLSPTLALVGDPCATSPIVRCEGGASGYLTVARLEPGVYYVIADDFSPAESSRSFTFDLVPTSPRPAGDSCATVQPLTFAAGVASVTGDTTFAANDNQGHPGISPSCSPLATYNPDVVYSITLTQPQDVHVAMDTKFSGAFGGQLVGVVALQRACGAPAAGDEIDCQLGNASGSRFDFTRHNLPAGTYYLWIDAESPGAFDLKVTLLPATTLFPQDTCAAPAMLSANGPVVMDTGYLGADYPYDCGKSGGGTGGADAVYQFSITKHQKVTIDTTAFTAISLSSVCAELAGGASCLSNRNSPYVNWDLPPGTYYALIKQWTTEAAQLQVTLNLDTAVPTAANDTCAGAKPIVFANNTATDSVLMGSANHDYVGSKCDPMFYQFNLGPDVVYSVPVPAGKTLSVLGAGKDQDPIIFTSGSICPTTIPELVCAIGIGGTSATMTYTNSTASAQNVLVVVQVRQDVSTMLQITDPMNLTFTLK